MGFISKNTSQITLNAYYTQLGRSLFISGTESDKIISYFSLGDDDVDYAIALNNNIEGTGFVPDLTGDVDNCIPSIASGVDIKNLLFKTKNDIDNSLVDVTGNTGTVMQMSNLFDYEFRVNLNNQLNNDGKNFTTATVDLGWYISYLKTFGTYSTDITNEYNKVSSTIKSGIEILDTVNIFDKVNQINYPELSKYNSVFEISSSDYNLYKQFNRFTTNNDSFVVTPPYLNYQTSPLSFIFNNSQGVQLYLNNRTMGYGVWSVLNGTYSLISFTPLSELITNNYQITVDTSNPTTIVKPTVLVDYYSNNKYYTEYFILRSDYTTRLNNNFYPDNQYIKSFIDPNTNKTLIVRETELLSSFIQNRTDLFDYVNDTYYSSPLTIRVNSVNTDLKIKDGVLKVILKYNPTTVYTPKLTDTFVTLS